MNYVQITHAIVKHYGSIRKASKECGLSKTTFYELYNGKTLNPHINTHNQLVRHFNKLEDK